MTNRQPFGSPTAFIDLGHSRVPYYRVGRGPDVLFIHGWPLYSATFRAIVPRLRDRFTCHLIDLPGTGDSEWDASSEISLSAHARSVRTVVDRLGLTRYAIVAHDSGAVVARLLAADDSRVDGLVLGNSEIPGHHPWRLQLYLAVEHIPLGPLLFGAALQLRALRHSTLAYGACFADPEYIEGEFRELFLTPMLSSRRAVLGQRRILQTFDWRLVDDLANVHRRIRAPAKLIWGAHDPYFPVDRARATLDQYGGGASLAVIDPGKLFAHEEFPDTFANEAEPFLQACTSDRLERAS